MMQVLLGLLGIGLAVTVLLSLLGVGGTDSRHVAGKKATTRR